jgi:hypothetical protein
VLNRGFAAKLPDLGFIYVDDNAWTPCFLKLKKVPVR